MSRRNSFIILAALLFAVVLVSFMPRGESASKLASFCRDEPRQVEDIWQSYAVSGVLPAGGKTGERVEVDEHLWTTTSRDQKTSLAIAAFCRIADDQGNGSVYLIGWRDGDIKASVIDGNYFD